MNKRNLLVVVMIFLFGMTVFGQESKPKAPENDQISVRFVPLSGGGPKKLRAKTVDGTTVKIRNQKEIVSKSLLTKLNRNRSVNYWYKIEREGRDSSYVVTALTKKNAIGLSGSHLFPGDITNLRQRLPNELEPDFMDLSYRLYDFSFGLNINHQLWAKNRHSISFDFEPHYRQMYHEFLVPSYAIYYPSVDPDGMDYERHVTITDYQETYLTHAAALSIMLRYDLYFLKHVSLFLAAGAENLFTLIGRSEVNYDARYAGQYGPDLFNVFIDENGVYDFGTYNDNHFQNNDKTQFNFTLYGMAQVGLQFYLGRTLSIEVAGVYQKVGFKYPFERRVKAQDFRLSEEPGQYQRMMSVLVPSAKNRLGMNVKLKFNF